MAYDDTLPDNQNWVRFLIKDTAASPVFSDNEIDAVLSDEEATGKALKYFAAATLLDLRILRMVTAGIEGVKRKVTDELNVEFVLTDLDVDQLQLLAKNLRVQGARLNRQRPLAIRAYRTAQQINDWR